MEKIVSGSQMKNWFLRDPFMDFMGRYPHKVAEAITILCEPVQTKKRGRTPDTKGKEKKQKIDANQILEKGTVKESKFMGFLCERGNDFEEEQMAEIIEKFDRQGIRRMEELQEKTGKERIKQIVDRLGGTTVITVRRNDEEKDPARFDEWFNKTKECIKNGTPIIYQGYIVCRKRYQGGHGFPDLIVRSDYINRLVDYTHLSREEATLSAPELRGNYHYRIVDIKSGRLNLCADGIKLRNSNLYPCYKGQITMYNQGLGDIQGYVPQTAYILGNGYKYESHGEPFTDDNPFARMGEIQLDKWDADYPAKVDDAVNWYKELANGENWELVPRPKRPELYPNMSNAFPSIYTPLKKQFAYHIGELTMLWNVGTKHREKAHAKKVYSWRDKKCNTNLMEINGKSAELIDKMIKIQQGNTLIEIEPGRSDCLPYVRQKLELYVDFEIIQAPLIKDVFIFMIGIYAKSDTVDEFKVFTAEGTTDQDQFDIIDQFYRYILELSHDHNLDDFPQLFHWNHVEASYMCKVLDRLYDQFTTPITVMYERFHWFDLLVALRNDQLLIKDCFGYGLKQVTKKLHDHNLVEMEWPEGDCESGEDAMLAGYLHYYREPMPDAIQEVEKYNEIDCRAMHAVLEAVREEIGIDEDE
jgi:uncharacterized protein YprB with RNaseH-like and TPR domain